MNLTKPGIVTKTGIISNPAATTTPQNPKPETNTVSAPAAKPAPAATVEISPAAHKAHGAGPGHAEGGKRHPLNIIWGDSPK